MSIVVENLSKEYGQQKAVNDISFEIKTGEIVGFLGPNGAGKSTTMKMITCYLSPTHGNVTLDGYSILTSPEEVKKKIGYLPEHNPLYTEMAIIEYLKFCAEIQGVDKNQIPLRVKDMIELCGLTPERHKRIGELSKGYRQRVGLAQAMIHDPEVLILDEPTTGLDPNQIIEIRKLIKKLGKEKTVILSSHILPEVEATCDRILIINEGKIVADGTADALQRKIQGQEILNIEIEAENIDAVEIETALLSLDTIEKVECIHSDGKTTFNIQSNPETSSRKNIFNLCVEKGWYLLEMSGSQTRLEDVFRNLTLSAN